MANNFRQAGARAGAFGRRRQAPGLGSGREKKPVALTRNATGLRRDSKGGGGETPHTNNNAAIDAMQYACPRIAVFFCDFPIVILDDRDQIKRYGAARQHGINAQGEAERKSISMIIRPLTVFEREAVRKFYLSLSADDRRRRFCCALSDATISGYVDRMNFARDTILGAFDEAARIIGLAELVHGPDASEMAFSVRADKRGKKIGTTLLQKLMLRARICGARKVFVMFSPENTPMRRMASRAGMALSVVDGEAHAARELAAPSAQELAHWFVDESAAHGEYFSALEPARLGALARSTAAPAPQPILASAP